MLAWLGRNGAFLRKKKEFPTPARMFIRPKKARKQDNEDAITRSYHLIMETRSQQYEIPVRSADDSADVREQTQEHTSHSYFLHNFHQDEEGSSLVRVLLSSFLFHFLLILTKDKSLFNAHLQKDQDLQEKCTAKILICSLISGKKTHLSSDAGFETVV